MKSFNQFSIAAVLSLVLLVNVDAFSVRPHKTTVSHSSSTRLNGLFGGLGDAFKNDESLGKAENPGLKGGPKFNENVTVNGMQVKGAVAGQKLTVVANKVRVRIPVDCQSGDCGTCTVKLNGRKVKACQTPLPAGKAVIETNI